MPRECGQDNSNGICKQIIDSFLFSIGSTKCHALTSNRTEGIIDPNAHRDAWLRMDAHSLNSDPSTVRFLCDDSLYRSRSLFSRGTGRRTLRPVHARLDACRRNRRIRGESLLVERAVSSRTTAGTTRFCFSSSLCNSPAPIRHPLRLALSRQGSCLRSVEKTSTPKLLGIP